MFFAFKSLLSGHLSFIKNEKHPMSVEAYETPINEINIHYVFVSNVCHHMRSVRFLFLL